MTAATPLIEARRVSMSFPGVRALAEVDFDIHEQVPRKVVLPTEKITRENAGPR